MDTDKVVVWGLVIAWLLAWGVFTSWLADQKGRNPLSWFALGALFGPLTLLTVGLAPMFSEALDERVRRLAAAEAKMRDTDATT